MTRCIRCGAAKGRRSCPALSGWICAKCCATDRLVRIDCPHSCAHLEGELYQRERRRERGLRQGGAYVQARSLAFMPDEAALGVAMAIEGALYRLAAARGGIDARAAAAAVRFLRNSVGPVPAVAPAPDPIAGALVELARAPSGPFEALMSFDPEGRARLLERLASEIDRECGGAGTYWTGIASFFREVSDPRVEAPPPSRLATPGAIGPGGAAPGRLILGG